jgi:uncharacterized protein
MLIWFGGISHAAGPASTPAAEGAAFDVLVFSRTETFRHASIPVGISTIQDLGAANGFSVTATEDPGAFTSQNLRKFEVIVFLNTTGDVLDPPQQNALRRHIHRRKSGYVGIHSGADTEHGWPWYGKLVGAYFLAHPIQQSATFRNEGLKQPPTSHLARDFTVADEFYSFKSNPRPDVRVLLTIDEDTYMPDPNTTYLPDSPVPPTTGYMGDHPMSWCHDNAGGRSFYTALGHEIHMYALDWYRQHVLNGILTAAREVKTNCRTRPT